MREIFLGRYIYLDHPLIDHTISQINYSTKISREEVRSY